MPGGIYEDDDIKQMFSTHHEMSPQQINDDMSNLLDYSLKETKKFIKDYIERV